MTKLGEARAYDTRLGDTQNLLLQLLIGSRIWSCLCCLGKANVPSWFLAFLRGGSKTTVILKILGLCLPVESETFLLTKTRITTGMTWQPNILHDAIPWFMGIVFADNALQHYKNASALAEQNVPSHMSVFELKWKDEFLDCPVFRPTQSSRQPMTQTQFRASWGPLLQQAGYTRPVTIHRIRQAVSNAIDGQSRSRRIMLYLTDIRARHAIPEEAGSRTKPASI
jgi:hypothetical protein